jgi:hypothetical protein
MQTLIGSKKIQEQHKNKIAMSIKKEAMSKRDEKILHRCFYYARYAKCDYRKALAQLGEEFDLSEKVVEKIIEINEPFLAALKAKPLTPYLLKKKYPYFSWGKTKRI